MKLDSVIIKNFRSIETARVAKCDGFNVLIGKNNSGKSNILSAINAFFICLKDGNLASLHPPIGIDTDFFKKNNSEGIENIQPIEITQIFLLSQDEISSLKNAIIKETPQMKTAVDGITSSRLSATIRVNRSDSPFSFISKLALVGEIVDGNDCELEKVLLEISNDAALEFKDNLLNKKNLVKNIERAERLLRHIEPNDFTRILEMPERETAIS